MLKKRTLIYSLVCLIAVLFTWMIHEFFHWAMSESLGYDAVMTLNTVYLKSGGYQSQSHANLVSAAGPLITILQALIVFFYLRKKGWNNYLYPFLFTAFYTRFMAMGMSFLNLNDEARISKSWGIGTFTLPFIVSVFLFFLVYDISKRYQLKWRFQFLTIFLVMLFSSILILSDQFLDLKLLE